MDPGSEPLVFILLLVEKRAESHFQCTITDDPKFPRYSLLKGYAPLVHVIVLKESALAGAYANADPNGHLGLQLICILMTHQTARSGLLKPCPWLIRG